MAVNRGKKFEDAVKESFLKVLDTSVVRLHDQTNGYLGGSNHCDFIVYHKPYEYHLECKSVHGNTLSIHSNPKMDRNGILHGFYGNITDKQWEGLLEKSEVPGIIAGVICWWIDKDITRFIPINTLKVMRECGYKSYKYDIDVYQGELSRIINGTKKRVFFDYDMEEFFREVEGCQEYIETHSEKKSHIKVMHTL